MRIKNITNILNNNNADAIILFNEANMHYFCNFSPSEGCIIILKSGDAFHIVDSRYTETAKVHSDSTKINVIEYTGSIYNTINNIFKSNNIKKVLFENLTISYIKYNQLISNQNVELLPLDNQLMELRNVKNEIEIQHLKRANEIAEKSFLELLNHVKIGKSEKELAAYFDYLMSINGSDGVSFETILLSGKNTSKPHGVPSDKKICNNEFILFDFGATYKGYHSDMTRTVVIGEPSDEMMFDYNCVLEAQLEGIKSLKSGISCKDLYYKSYNVLQKYNKEKFFRHSLGHGIGLEIHEGYNASPFSKNIYQKGNITSIEPGIYIPGKYGIRIEDMLCVGDNNSMNISTIDKKLLKI